MSHPFSGGYDANYYGIKTNKFLSSSYIVDSEKKEAKKGHSSVIGMQVRVLRRLTFDEVEERIEELERAQGMSFDEFEEQILTAAKIGDDSLDTYFKWARLVHAYRGYMEDGELHCVVEELHDLSPNELRSLTPKRLELLYALSDLRVESVNDLARKIKRDVKNVYQDLQALKQLGLIRLSRKRDRKMVPEVLVEELTFITQ